MGDSRHEVQVAWEFVLSGVLTVATLSDRDLPDLEALMRRYHDRPMDFADATLVRLGERESLSTVFRSAVWAIRSVGSPLRPGGFKSGVRVGQILETQ